MAHHGGRHRIDLVGEHPFGDAGQIILLCVFLLVWIGDSFILKLSTMATQYVPVSVRTVLFLACMTSAGILAQRGLSMIFGEERERPCVIRNGVFNLVRHPIYLGSIMFYFSCLLLSLSLLSVLVWLVIIVFYVFISRHEEKLLLERFGEEYAGYMRDVPMLIPWTKRKKR